jgi:hypothetical protein
MYKTTVFSFQVLHDPGLMVALGRLGRKTETFVAQLVRTVVGKEKLIDYMCASCCGVRGRGWKAGISIDAVR